MKRILKELIEKKLAKRILPLPLPRGWDMFADMKHLCLLRGLKIDTILDVGANVGQTAETCAIEFPEAAVYSFEPVRSTYEHLLANTRHLPSVKCICSALGAERGEMEISLQGPDSETNSLVPGLNPQTSETETISVTTVDLFMSENQIPKVGWLKIDAEGFDLEVLKGAQTTLERGKVEFVSVEVGLSELHPRFVSLTDVQTHLRPLGYKLMGLYDQAPWDRTGPVWFCNALFAASPVDA